MPTSDELISLRIQEIEHLMLDAFRAQKSLELPDGRVISTYDTTKIIDALVGFAKEIRANEHDPARARESGA